VKFKPNFVDFKQTYERLMVTLDLCEETNLNLCGFVSKTEYFVRNRYDVLIINECLSSMVQLQSMPSSNPCLRLWCVYILFDQNFKVILKIIAFFPFNKMSSFVTALAHIIIHIPTASFFFINVSHIALSQKHTVIYTVQHGQHSYSHNSQSMVKIDLYL
jgi:hypothetical protein